MAKDIEMVLLTTLLCLSWAWILGGSTVELTTSIQTAASLMLDAPLQQDVLQKSTGVSNKPLQLISRLPSVSLIKYQAYKDVSILHFNIPNDTGRASFMFRAYTHGARCIPQDVTLYLKFGSYPVISVEVIPFPEHFINQSQRPPIYHREFKANGIQQFINLTNPLPGDWFGIAFISYTNPKHDKIEQQGIAASCDTRMLSELSVLTGKIKEIKHNQNYSLEMRNNIDLPLIFDIPKEYDEAEIVIESPAECQTCEMTLKLHTFTYLNDSIMKNTTEKVFTSGNKTIDRMKFDVTKNTFYYLDLNINEPSMPLANFTVNLQLNTYINDTISSEYQISRQNYDGFDNYPLLRQTYSEFFTFDYDLLPDINGTTPAMLNISSNRPVLLKFPIHAIHDIGGTFSLGVSLKVDTSRYLKDSGFDFRKEINYTLLACLRRDEVGIPQLPNKCVYENNVQLPATINVNNSQIESSIAMIHVPYPEPGDWHVLFKLFCDNIKLDDAALISQFLTRNLKQLSNFTKECECYEMAMNCTRNSSLCSNLTDGDLQQLKHCLFNPVCSTDFKNLTQDFHVMEQRNGVCETNFIFTISSSPCMDGKCSEHGRCYHYMSSGFVYSTCVCFKNYRGWDCSDGTDVITFSTLLKDIVLLTTSNLVFGLSSAYALRERYYTEAVVYAFTCIFSTFYHACDAGEDAYSFCIVQLRVLQFADFYCGLLSIWVTLVAMANIKQYKYKSLLHMLGCILLAFGTEMDKQSLWVFLMPAITGLVLVCFMWMLQYRRKRRCHLANRYWKIFLPMGFITVSVGLICYAFLQTNDNYSFVHSSWHIVMGLSIIMLLPSRKSFLASSLTDNNLIQNIQFDNELPITNSERLVDNSLLDKNGSALHQRNK